MRTLKNANISPLEKALIEDFGLTPADDAKPKKIPLWQRVVGGVAAAAFYAMTLFGAGAALQACDDNVNNTPVAVSGSATDGPYVNGSEVTLVELTNSLVPTTNTIIQWTDDLGRYSAELSRNTKYMGSVDGFNFDEIAGRPSTAPVDLRGFFEIGSSPGAEYNINDVTHLIAERVKYLVDSGTAFDDADTQALNELLSELDMVVSTPGCHAYEMDIVSGANDCDNFLLAVEILVRGYAHARAEATGDPVDATLQDLINSAALYFKNSGTMSDDFKNGLRAAAADTDIVQAVQNLADYFAARGMATVPDADAVIDSDRDGTPNSLDDDIDGDGVLNVDDSDPRNPNVRAGAWCDPDTALCWQYEPPATTYALPDAIAYCDGLELDGSTEWRLPTIDELRTLVRGCPDSEMGGACEIIDGCNADCDSSPCFSCEFMETECYLPEAIPGCTGWARSSSVIADRPDHSWVINFETAHVAGSYSQLGDNSVPASVRCVR
ncbi:DUF1566 domain-containing protein [Candidatus Woesearchaeota archaeon]|nr:DUF1566 domain-containing protein [Candidatus Woesearchaeota archaeon]